MKRREKQSLRAMSDQKLVKHIRAIESEIAKDKLGRKVAAKRLAIAVTKTILGEREIIL